MVEFSSKTKGIWYLGHWKKSVNNQTTLPLIPLAVFHQRSRVFTSFDDNGLEIHLEKKRKPAVHWRWYWKCSLSKERRKCQMWRKRNIHLKISWAMRIRNCRSSWTRQSVDNHHGICQKHQADQGLSHNHTYHCHHDIIYAEYDFIAAEYFCSSLMVGSDYMFIAVKKYFFKRYLELYFYK